jgi:putative peptidoglycan lipid II flippase
MPGFLKSSLQVATGTLASRILGLFRDVLMASLIPKTVTDTFFVAFRIPNMFRSVLGEGALPMAMVPVYQRILQEKTEAHATEYFRKFQGLLGVILVLIVALGVVFSPWIISLLTPGWRAFPDKLDHASLLLQGCFPYLFFISLVSCYTGILNARQHFWIPSFSAALLNLAFLIALGVGWFTSTRLGTMDWSWFLVAAVICGGVLQWWVNAMAVHYGGLGLGFSWGWTGEIKQTLKMIFPSLMTLSGIQINLLITTVFASYLVEGSISSLYYAARLVEFPLGLIAVSMSVVLLPRIQQDAVPASVYLNRALFLLLPIATAVFVVPELWVRLVFSYGQFDASMVDMTSVALRFGALSILGGGVSRIFSTYAFSKQRPWFPARLSLGGAVLHGIFCSLWVKTLGLTGIVLSLGVVSLFQGAMMLTSGYVQIWQRFQGKETAKLMFSAAMMALVIGMVNGWSQGLPVFVSALAVMASGVLTFLGGLKLLNSLSLEEWIRAARNQISVKAPHWDF